MPSSRCNRVRDRARSLAVSWRARPPARPAERRISAATSEEPRPASPARQASSEPLSARRSLRSATSRMTSRISPIRLACEERSPMRTTICSVVPSVRSALESTPATASDAWAAASESGSAVRLSSTIAVDCDVADRARVRPRNPSCRRGDRARLSIVILPRGAAAKRFHAYQGRARRSREPSRATPLACERTKSSDAKRALPASARTQRPPDTAAASPTKPVDGYAANERPLRASCSIWAAIRRWRVVRRP
jgi:hypothetical protein